MMRSHGLSPLAWMCRVPGWRILAAAAAAVIALAPAAHAQSISTTVSNNGTGGVFLDLTPAAGALIVTGFSSQFGSTAGTPVTVEVWTRPGTYVGFTTSNAGWTLSQTVSGVSAGTTTNSPTISLTSPITLPAGGPTGLYLHGITTGGALRYTGTGTTAVTTYSNSDITLFSNVARTGTVAFAGTANTPRCFSGVIEYQPANPNAIGACCFADGSCQFISLSDCQTGSGIFRGENVTCVAAACPQPGACCAPNANCTFSLPSLCSTSSGGSFFAGQACAAVTCPHVLLAPVTNSSSTIQGMGIFFDLAASSAGSLSVTRIDYTPNAAAGAAVSVDIYVRDGTYVGFDASSTGWRLLGTIAGTSNGNTATSLPVQLTLPTPIFVPQGGVSGVYLVGTTGSLRYNTVATNVTNGELTLTSDRVRSVLFAGTLTTPRGFAGGGVYYTTVATSALGACCPTTGACAVSTLADCMAQSGLFRGENIACSVAACPEAGQCCAVDGTCTFVLPSSCATPATFTAGTCSPNVCPAGACCKQDGACTFVTSNWCTTTGGVFTSNSTTCAAAACPQPGACCLSNGGCVALTASACTAISGTFQTPGALCGAGACWTAPILYHNGGIVTNAGAATGGADACLIATGAATLGENWSSAANVSVADDFTIPTGQSWTLTKFHTFGYQTAAPTSPVPYTAMFVRIWDRDPRDPAAIVVWGDLTTNVLDTATSVWSNTYRVQAIPGDTQRPLFDLVANIPSITLTAGTYWVEFRGTNGVTPFMPGVHATSAGAPVLPFGNALIMRNAPWVPVVDTGFQAASWINAGGFPYNLPFILEGTHGGAGVCCRGSTCSTTVAQAACTGSGTAGAAFLSNAAACNPAPTSNAPCCVADYNKVNGVTVTDIFDFLSDWFASSPFAMPGGDGSAGSLQVQNIFDFLTAWFAGGCT